MAGAVPKVGLKSDNWKWLEEVSSPGEVTEAHVRRTFCLDVECIKHGWVPAQQQKKKK